MRTEDDLYKGPRAEAAALETASRPAPLAPEFDVQITSIPAVVKPEKNNLTVLGTTTKSGPITISSVKVKVANGLFQNAQATAPGFAKWSFTTSLQISGTVTVTAQAQVGVNTKTATANVKVDGQAPLLDILLPPPNFLVEGQGPIFALQVEGTASDAQSGIKAVVASLDTGETFPASGSTDWKAVVQLTGEGPKTIHVTAFDLAGNPRGKSVQGIAADTVAPLVTIVDPNPLPAEITAPTIKVVGTTFDGTGIDSVKWQLDDGAFQLATPLAGDWTTWEAPIPLPSAGDHVIRFVARDTAVAANESQPIEWAFTVPALDEVRGTNLSAYLHDLLEFPRTRIVDADGAKIEAPQLEEAFHHPFTRIDETAAADGGFRSVSHVRICVDVLRRLFAGEPAQGEERYREAAYQALLRAIGTSYDELRLARGADAETRDALARRLGIVLTAARPNDELDQLFLTPERLALADSEADLEALFGFVDTRHDPFQDGPQAKLHVWRRQYVRAQWAQQDGASSPDVTPIPIIDPDLIRPADMKTTEPGTPVFDKWQERTAWVQEQLDDLRAKPKGPPVLDAFDAIVASVLIGIELETLIAAYDEGVDIGPVLANNELSLAAFVHLVRLRRLAAMEALLNAEWEDVFSILVQAKKRRSKFRTWREEELLLGLTLGPDFFRLDEGGVISLPRLRATTQARRAWERTLEARTEQDAAVRDGLANVVTAAETEALPLLRDRLIANVEMPADGPDAADWLTLRLQIDMRSGASQRTTRLRQAVETLQETFFSLRTDRLDALEPLLGPLPFTGWRLTSEATFDEEWRWMGAFEAWQGAILVFCYPENYLLPGLRLKDSQSVAFQQLVEKLRLNVRLTPKDARDLARGYFHHPNAGDEPASGSPFAELQALLGGVSTPTARDFEPTDRRSDAEVDALRGASVKLFATMDDPKDPPEIVAEVCLFVPILIAQHLQKSGHFLAALDWYQSVYAYNVPRDLRKIYRGLVEEETIPESFTRSEQWLQGDNLNPHVIVRLQSPRRNAYTRSTVMSLVRCFLEFADAEFTRDTLESVPRARSLYLAALDLLQDLAPPIASDGPRAPFEPNSLPASLRLHGETSLSKIRAGRNIAGLERDTTLGLQIDGPSVVADIGAVLAPGGGAFRPTPYRFAALLARAKELAAHAQQMEAAFLAALEKRDAEAYSLLQARQHLELARATQTLQRQRVFEAKAGITVAILQQHRATLQVETFDDWLDAGLLSEEESAKRWTQASALLSTVAAALHAVDAKTSFVGNTLALKVGNSVGALASASSSLASASSSMASLRQMEAGFERRREEWLFQKALATSDQQMATQQLSIAKKHVVVAEQEQLIATLQATHAQATTDFLANKFTNLELYDFMSGVLASVYAYFLQQSTATAALAERQLAFERQEAVARVIQADYWQPPSEVGAGASGTAEPDRRGLTGSARLLQDIFRLDQHAFDSRRRLLQIAQAFSVAQLDPFAFETFRTTGVLPFATPMTVFDRSFPGHYLRLIRRIRVSVVALVRPIHGLRATLTISGVSRVVVAGGPFHDVFRPIDIRRPPEQISFTGAFDATGLLELEAEGDLLLPFEGHGVDTTWELALPKAANLLDYNSIADVLVTIEYTALHSVRYQEDVIQRLDPTISADRGFSLRHEFPDAFYLLSNPIDDGPPRCGFTTTIDHFTPNVKDLEIEEVLVLFVLKAPAPDDDPTRSLEVVVRNFLFASEPELGEPATVAVGGPANSTDHGIISTRRGNGVAWEAMRTRTPAGRWELELATDMRPRLERGEIEDVVLVITHGGHTLAWPGQTSR